MQPSFFKSVHLRTILKIRKYVFRKDGQEVIGKRDERKERGYKAIYPQESGIHTCRQDPGFRHG
jgi:hypothetical protein